MPYHFHKINSIKFIRFVVGQDQRGKIFIVDTNDWRILLIITASSPRQGTPISFSFDPEDISRNISGMIENMSYGENSDIVVAKVSYAGKKKKDGSMSGTRTSYVKVYFDDLEAPGSVIIEKKFKAITAAF